jgi:hypothetical protein
MMGYINDLLLGASQPALRVGSALAFLPTFLNSDPLTLPDTETSRIGFLIGTFAGSLGFAADLAYTSAKALEGEYALLSAHIITTGLSLIWEAGRYSRQNPDDINNYFKD